MLSRKPTAIKLTQEDIYEYDDLVAQQEAQTPSTDTSNPPSKKKGKETETETTAQDRQAAMDARIGVATSTGTARR